MIKNQVTRSRFRLFLCRRGHPDLTLSTPVVARHTECSAHTVGKWHVKNRSRYHILAPPMRLFPWDFCYKLPTYHQCEIYFLLTTCHAHVVLYVHLSFEVPNVDCSLQKNIAPIIMTDHILITSQEWDTISIIPSRSDL